MPTATVRVGMSVLTSENKLRNKNVTGDKEENFIRKS